MMEHHPPVHNECMTPTVIVARLCSQQAVHKLVQSAGCTQTSALRADRSAWYLAQKHTVFL